MQARAMYKLGLLRSWAADNRCDALSIVGAFVVEGVALLGSGDARSSEEFRLGTAFVSFLLWYGVIDFFKLINIKCVLCRCALRPNHPARISSLRSPDSPRSCCHSIRSSATWNIS